MSSPVGGLRNVKIFVLYLMENIGYPLDYLTINDIVMQNDYVMYLDFAQAFTEMSDAALVEVCGKDALGNDLYCVSEKGRCVAEELQSDILPAILKHSMRCALRYLDFRKRGVSLDSDVQKTGNGKYRVHLVMREKEEVIFETALLVDSAYRAQEITRHFRDMPEVVYKGTMAILSGDASYLDQ
ncbi:putative uncharacterized protein [Clostridium sp. CAG:448]|nr:putative uncharacterized protein [Clostridium sp. CAG:448]